MSIVIMARAQSVTFLLKNCVSILVNVSSAATSRFREHEPRASLATPSSLALRGFSLCNTFIPRESYIEMAKVNLPRKRFNLFVDRNSYPSTSLPPDRPPCMQWKGYLYKIRNKLEIDMPFSLLEGGLRPLTHRVTHMTWPTPSAPRPP